MYLKKGYKTRFMIMGYIILIEVAVTVPVNEAMIDNGDGTITESDTNLMWLQDANYALTSGYPAFKTLQGPRIRL